MSNKPIEMRKIKRIYKFDSQGLSHRKISIQLGVSRPTIKKYLAEIKKYELTLEEVQLMSIEELSQLFGQEKKVESKRLKILKKYFPYFDTELKKTGVTRRLLWEEYISKHPDGLKLSQFSYWYQQWSLAISPVMHFNHKAGDKLFIDYTGKKLQVVDPSTGEVKQAEVIICVLGCSQMTYVEATYTQRKEDFIKSIENSLWFFKGVPSALVTDNLKAAVKKSSKYEPVLNETFSDFADYYQTTVLPTRAYKPRDKAIVENAVKIIYTRVFAKLRTKTFHTLKSLNIAILEQLEIHNQMPFRGRAYSRKDIYEQTELESLNPLPIKRYSLKKLASYIGFIPSMHQSGEGIYTGGSTPRANKHVRNMIIEASWIAIRIDPVMQNNYRSHAGKNSKAVIFKVRRKLLSKIMAVIKTERDYSIGVVS